MSGLKPVDWFFNRRCFYSNLDFNNQYGITRELKLKIHSDFYEKELEPYMNLWIAVLDRAIKDASGNFAENKYGSFTRKRLQDEAIRFLKDEDWIYNILGMNKKYFLRKLNLND